MAKHSAKAPENAFVRAQAHIERGEYADAEKQLKAIISRDPKYPGAYYGLGCIARATQHHAHAIPLFQEALRLEPGNSLYRKELAQQLINCGQPQPAREIIQQGVDNGGDDAESLRALLASLKPGATGELSQAALERLRALAAHEKHSELLEATRSLLGSYENDLDVLYYHAMATLYVGDPAQAARELEHIVERRPDHDEAWGQLGIARMHLGKPRSCMAAHERALRLKPGESTHHINAGLCYFEFGALDLCEEKARQALALKGDSAPAITLLGKVAAKRWEYDKAALLLRKALELKPGYRPAQAALVDVMYAEGRLKDTEWECRRLMVMAPASADVINTLIDSLLGQQNTEEALKFAEHGVATRPSEVSLQNRLGICYYNVKRYKDAIRKYQEILKLSPDFFPSLVNLAGMFSITGDHDLCMEHFSRLLEMDDIKPEHVSNWVFAKLYDPDTTAESLLEISQDWAQKYYGETPPYTDWKVDLSTDSPLRVGIVSGDLRNHPVGFFLESVVRELVDRGVEVYLYSTVLVEDETTKRFQDIATHWHRAYRDSPTAFAEIIRNDQVKVLFDVAGHTAHNRLSVFARKPAPVQITWLGYLSTTGLDTMDYIIGDPWVTPAGEEHHFSETPLVLPRTYQCLSEPGDSPDVNALPALENGYVTFGSFNNFAKLNDPVVEVWSRVLLAVPGSRLLLKNQVLTDTAFQDRLRKRFAEHGVEASRLMFEASRSREHILESYGRVDIGLDPFPYTGCTTTFESLWMGVPVVSRQGERFLSHAGESILNNLGIPDWIAADSDEYVRLAAEKAADIESLAALRAGLRDRVMASPLMDSKRFAQDMHEALSGVWADWLESAPAMEVGELS